jgi:hypothetical protein
MHTDFSQMRIDIADPLKKLETTEIAEKNQRISVKPR